MRKDTEKLREEESVEKGEEEYMSTRNRRDKPLVGCGKDGSSAYAHDRIAGR